MISSPSVKIQIMGRKVCLRCKGKTLLGIVNKLLKTKKLLIMPSNVLPLLLKQTLQTIIWIFTEGEGDRIKSRLPFLFFSTSLPQFFWNWDNKTSLYFFRFFTRWCIRLEFVSNTFWTKITQNGHSAFFIIILPVFHPAWGMPGRKMGGKYA